MNTPSWHQVIAARNLYALREHKAHIQAPDYIESGKSLCGQTAFRVYVRPEHAHNPANHVCKKCLKALETRNPGNP